MNKAKPENNNKINIGIELTLLGSKITNLKDKDLSKEIEIYILKTNQNLFKNNLILDNKNQYLFNFNSLRLSKKNKYLGISLLLLYQVLQDIM